MHQPAVSRSLALGLTLSTLAAAAAFGQTKYRLRDTYSPGDAAEVDAAMDMNLNLHVPAAGSQGSDQLTFVQRHREQYREEVLGADRNGYSGLRRTYSIARTVITDPSLRDTKKISSLQGKTVTIQRQGGHVAVSANRGPLDPKDRQSLLPVLDHTDMDYFPDHEVAPGEEWSVDSKRVAGMIVGMQKAEVKCRFQDVVPYAGRRCARIHLTFDVTSHPEGALEELKMKLAGDLYQALDLRRTLAVELRGPVTAQVRSTERGQTSTVSADGTMRIKETHHWLKAGGRRVATGG